MYIQQIGLTRLGTDSGAADLVAPPFHRPRRCRNGAGSDRSYQFLRAAGAPVRRRRGAGAPAARKN